MSARKLRKRKDGRTDLSLDEAVWQYLLDHARPHYKFGYIASFSFRSKEGFERSLRGRQQGWYRFTKEEVDAGKVITTKIRIKNPPTIPMWKRRLISFIHRL